jgi:hypothetical protein
MMFVYMLAAFVGLGAATKLPIRNEEVVYRSTSVTVKTSSTQRSGSLTFCSATTSLSTGLLLTNVSHVGDFSQHFTAPPLPRNLRAGPRRLSWPVQNIFKGQNYQNGQNKCFTDQNSWCSCEESCCESSTSSYCCPNSLCDLANNLCAWPT